MDKNQVIGHNNDLPWRLSADLKHFKSITMGKTIIMGRKTFDSIGKPLPGRQNIVITQSTSWQQAGCEVAHNIEQAIAKSQSEEIMLIGGASIYQQVLPQAQRFYLTLIHDQFEGDTFFPEIDWEQWQECSREDHLADDKNPHPFSFITYDRN